MLDELSRNSNQDFAYQGAILIFTADYVPYREGVIRLQEAWFLDLLGHVLAGEIPLSEFAVKIRAFNEMNSGLFDKTGQLTGMARNMERFFLDRYHYSDQDILARLHDYQNWVNLGSTKAMIPGLKEQISRADTHHLPTVVHPSEQMPQQCSSLHTDILHRMYWVIEGALMVHDFFAWFANPLIVWEIALQVRDDTLLWELVAPLHVYWYKYTYEDYASEDVIQQFCLITGTQHIRSSSIV